MSLLNPDIKNESKCRIYSDDSTKRIQFIRNMQARPSISMVRIGLKPAASLAGKGANLFYPYSGLTKL
ncbi:hypothetical protein LEP1GSC058_4129 [Leptospira fainei serovar Hurstbridge str. BUT 6]|uniref:Uncharacterized protein n=1 Tax=Leptospira fainei serovar Hurstbridge str. BUT 6 TaxID=1193011 RepID=S3URK4_9LEPT|nr:hypothetical protein LEP1GSC058_4129 [Leptospira fainei serovar Hurstbridge str. BUT 6]